MNKIVGLTLLLISIAGYAFAGNPTPEIDGSTGIAALGLLSGGMVVLMGRRRRK